MSIALCQNIARFLIAFLPGVIRNLFDLHMHEFCTLNSCCFFAKKAAFKRYFRLAWLHFFTFYRIYTTYRAFWAFCRTFYAFFVGIFAPLGELFAPLGELFAPLGELFAPLGELFAPFTKLFTPFTEPQRLLLNFRALY